MLAKRCVSALKVQQETETRLTIHFENTEHWKITIIASLPFLLQIIRQNEDTAKLGRVSLNWSKIFPMLILMLTQ